MEVKYFDILSYLRKTSRDAIFPDRFVSAFVLNTLYDYQLRDSSIFSYTWIDENDSIIDLHDVQKWIENYCQARQNCFIPYDLRVCINMIKAIYTICLGV